MKLSAPSPATPSVIFSQPFEAVLFDLDGTLIDSGSAVERAWTHWATDRGLAAHEVSLSHGVPARALLARMVPAEEVDEQLALIVQLEIAMVEGIALLAGAARALAALGDRAAIVTSCTRALFVARADAAGVVAPRVCVTADDVVHGKPDPAPFLLAAHLLGIDPERCLVVEDAPAGLTSARAAGCSTLAVTTTHAAEDLEADVIMSGLGDVDFTLSDAGTVVVWRR